MEASACIQVKSHRDTIAGTVIQIDTGTDTLETVVDEDTILIAVVTANKETRRLVSTGSRKVVREHAGILESEGLPIGIYHAVCLSATTEFGVKTLSPVRSKRIEIEYIFDFKYTPAGPGKIITVDGRLIHIVDVLAGIHHVNRVGRLAETRLVRIIKLGTTLLALTGGNQYNSVCCAGTINGRCRSIFEYLNRLHVVKVELSKRVGRRCRD